MDRDYHHPCKVCNKNTGHTCDKCLLPCHRVPCGNPIDNDGMIFPTCHDEATAPPVITTIDVPPTSLPVATAAVAIKLDKFGIPTSVKHFHVSATAKTSKVWLNDIMTNIKVIILKYNIMGIFSEYYYAF